MSNSTCLIVRRLVLIWARYAPRPSEINYIPMKLSNVKFSALAGVAACGMFLLSGCRPSGDGKIPVDEKNAAVHIISSAQGEAYIRSFKVARTELSRVADSFASKQFILPTAEAFNRDAIAALLNADGAVGIRIYLGRDDSGQVRLVLAPMDKNGQDIITKLVSVETPPPPPPGPNAPHVELLTKGQFVDIGQRCPTMCDSLNNN
jgi:hypothetical protein